jgi:hypothetical protein
MRITDLRKGDTVLCCDVEQRVEHVVLHPSDTVVVMQDGALLTKEHMEANGWQVRGIWFSEPRPEAALERAIDALYAQVVEEGNNSTSTAHERAEMAML